jgi:hypothetical protein
VPLTKTRIGATELNEPHHPARIRGSFFSNCAPKVDTAMWHNLLWIGGIWLIAVVVAWLICRFRGYNATAWAFTISAFCLGLFVGAENTTHGRFKVPFLSDHHYRQFTHHTASR